MWMKCGQTQKKQKSLQLQKGTGSERTGGSACEERFHFMTAPDFVAVFYIVGFSKSNIYCVAQREHSSSHTPADRVQTHINHLRGLKWDQA